MYLITLFSQHLNYDLAAWTSCIPGKYLINKIFEYEWINNTDLLLIMISISIHSACKGVEIVIQTLYHDNYYCDVCMD